MTYAAHIPHMGRFEAWRDAARRAISHAIPPSEIDWTGGGGLFAAAPLPPDIGPHQARVPQAFLKFAGQVLWHSAPERLPLLYQALWNIDQGTGQPMSQADPLGRRLHLMAKSVSRDIHKMHAFVRFRELPNDGGRRRFGAWFEPEHDTLEPGAPFFAKRFGDMDWLIATPKLTARFEGGKLTFHEGEHRPDLPDDAAEGLWATYFANIFNPARVKLDAMRSEMPKKYWKNLPETRLIPDMLKDAEARVARMQEAGASTPRAGAEAISTRYRAAMPQAVELPETMDQARTSASLCTRCDLCHAATQTVWSEGPQDAPLMIVGEQPGDHEDLQGRPFVGPAGQLLREIMAEVRADPARSYLTNAVKHFKFTPRGKQRLHQNPDRGEITQCRWWLGLELAFVAPQVTLALGASAAFALTDDATAISKRRGTVETGLHGGPVVLSWHPSYILRLPDPAAKARARADLAADLALALRMVTGTAGG